MEELIITVLGGLFLLWLFKEMILVGLGLILLGLWGLRLMDFVSWLS